MKKLGTKAMTIAGITLFTAPMLLSLTHAEELGDLGTTATTTSASTGTDTLDLGATDTGTTDTTTTDNTPDDNLGGDLGGTDTTTNDTVTTEGQNQIQIPQPIYEPVKSKEYAYKFEMNIPDPSKSYVTVTEFEQTTGDLTLVNFVVNNNNIDDNLKNSLELVIKSKDGTTNNVKLSDLELKPVTIANGSKVYIVYNPNGVDNSSTLALSNNKLNIYAEQITKPVYEGELSYNNGEIIVKNPVEYKLATVNYEVQPENIKTVTVKKALTKKDTGPVENVLLLIIATILALIGGRYVLKSENK